MKCLLKNLIYFYYRNKDPSKTHRCHAKLSFGRTNPQTTPDERQDQWSVVYEAFYWPLWNCTKLTTNGSHRRRGSSISQLNWTGVANVNVNWPLTRNSERVRESFPYLTIPIPILPQSVVCRYVAVPTLFDKLWPNGQGYCLIRRSRGWLISFPVSEHLFVFRPPVYCWSDQKDPHSIRIAQLDDTRGTAITLLLRRVPGKRILSCLLFSGCAKYVLHKN